jgi:chemotaxis family two-component system response regulator PixH
MEMDIEKKCPVTPERARRNPPVKLYFQRDPEMQFRQSKSQRPGPVLVIDDSAEVCQLLKLYMQIDGLDVITATEAKDALDMLLNDEIVPSLIVLDLAMPTMDGREFLEHKNRHHLLADIPVLVFSGKPQKEDLQGVQGWANKATDLKYLLELVKAHVHPIEA